jgi:hypothetical protein
VRSVHSQGKQPGTPLSTDGSEDNRYTLRSVAHTSSSRPGAWNVAFDYANANAQTCLGELLGTCAAHNSGTNDKNIEAFHLNAMPLAKESLVSNSSSDSAVIHTDR